MKTRSPYLNYIADYMLTKHYSLSTVNSYIGWIANFSQFYQKRHPSSMGDNEVESFLDHLVLQRNMSPRTQMAALLVGVTPKQHSSGGKALILGIDKCGSVKELRSLLYLGAMSYVGRMPDEPKTQKDAWLAKIIDRIGFRKVFIALANITVRTAWAMLRYETNYKPVLI